MVVADAVADAAWNPDHVDLEPSLSGCDAIRRRGLLGPGRTFETWTEPCPGWLVRMAPTTWSAR